MKNILIAGASKGIGLRLAQLCAPDHTLYTLSRTISAELQALDTTHFSMDVVNDPLDALQE